MQIQGQITNIVPDGSYVAQGNTIYTFQMTIQGQRGVFTVQIGSKSQAYPIAVGQPIMVEMTETQHGVRFKKINPQYQPSQAPQQQQMPTANIPQQPTYNPVPQEKPRDYDKENHGKCFSLLCQAVLQSGIAPMSLQADPDSLTAIADLATACMNSYNFRTPKPQTYEQNNEPEDIPWEQG